MVQVELHDGHQETLVTVRGQLPVQTLHLLSGTWCDADVTHAQLVKYPHRLQDALQNNVGGVALGRYPERQV